MKETTKHILIVLILGLFCYAIYFYVAYSNFCNFPDSVIGRFLFPETPFLGFRSPYLFLLIPISLVIWLIYVNGKEKLFKNLIAYILLLIITVILFFGLVIMSDLFLKVIGLAGIFQKYDSFQIVFYILLFFIAITFHNILLSKYERRKLSFKNIMILVVSQMSLIPISFISFWLLQTLIDKKILCENINQAIILWGNLLFAMILLEGIYFLWLKKKIGHTASYVTP